MKMVPMLRSFVICLATGWLAAAKSALLEKPVSGCLTEAECLAPLVKPDSKRKLSSVKRRGFEHLSFGFCICFDSRYSDFGFEAE
jgi:hypothetical protein